MNCRHCGRDRPLPRRGLCFPCYHDPEIRQAYPKNPPVHSAIMGRRPLGDPPTPTRAPVGSAWKIRVMAARAQAGYGVLHPDDNPTAFLMVSEKFWRKVVRRWERRQLKQREADHETECGVQAADNAVVQLDGDGTDGVAA